MKNLISSLFVFFLLISHGQSQASFAMNTVENYSSNKVETLAQTSKSDTPTTESYRHSFEQIKNELVKKITYPYEMEVYAIEGMSKVAVTVSPNGRLSNVTIIESLGTAFDMEIRKALLGTKIETDFADEQTIVFPVQFRLSR